MKTTCIQYSINWTSNGLNRGSLVFKLPWHFISQCRKLSAFNITLFRIAYSDIKFYQSVNDGTLTIANS